MSRNNGDHERQFKLAIGICTWNRSEFLRNTLLSLQQLIIPPDIDYEILIVNNNCTDNTDEVTEQAMDSLPIRLLHEKQQGHSNARNCAVEAAEGDYILWTDDDVIVDPNWLAAYVKAIQTWPNAAVFGGPIELKLEGSPPAWFLELLPDKNFASSYAERDLSDVPILLDCNKGIIPYGANLCLRMREQKALRYNPNLGRCLTEQVRAEETEVVRTLLASGAEGWWVPAARVRHVITEAQQTRAYLRKYYIGLGRSFVRVDPKTNIGSFCNALRWVSSAMNWELRFQVNRIRNRPTIWFRDLREASVCWGRIFESMRDLVPTFASRRTRQPRSTT